MFDNYQPDAQEILEKSTNMDDRFSEGFTEIVNMKIIDDSKFLSNPIFHDDPMKMLKNGDFNDVPLIIGDNEHEGLLFISFLEKIYKENFYKNAPKVILGR